MIELNYRDSRPIYEQIKETLKKQIVTGVMEEDEKLESVRNLAMRLSINPNTIQRAYNELESEGFIYSVRGKGSFVSKGFDARQKRIDEIKENINELLHELNELGVTKDEIINGLKGM